MLQFVMEAPEEFFVTMISLVQSSMESVQQHPLRKHSIRTDEETGKSKAKPSKKYTCSQCFRQFVYENGLARHLSKFHPELNEPAEGDSGQQVVEQQHPPNDDTFSPLFHVVLKCKTTGEIFPSAYLFQQHVLQFRYWERLCALDPRPVHEKVAAIFSDHVAIVTIHTVLRCELCDALFANCNALFYHESLHSPDVGFSCRFCNLCFALLRDVLNHRKTCGRCEHFRLAYFANATTAYCCNVCMGLFTTLPELYAHRYGENHLFPRRLTVPKGRGDERCGLWIHCEQCERLFDNVEFLLLHRAECHRTVEDGSALDELSATSSPSAQLQSVGLSAVRKKRPNEMEETNGDRPYLCDKCGKTYTQSSHLWQHLRFHNGVRPFACDREGCTRRFTIRPDLSDHIRKCHTGERPYECNVCHKRFLTGSVYYQHRLIHRGERRYGCPDCDRRFYRADALKNHQRIHTGEKPYVCDYCDRKFRQRGDREKHVRVKHKRLV